MKRSQRKKKKKRKKTRVKAIAEKYRI